MVAVINTGYSIPGIVNYNENKVKEGVAECIGAANYPVDPDKMSIRLKLKSFLKRVDLNQNVKRNSVHISLNFDVSESRLPKEKLLAIASIYMEKLGFGKQPYLIYQHHDAGHPHMHIVTTNIEADGKGINLHLMGIRKSEPARKYIEEIFDLVRAEEQGKQGYKMEAINAQRVQYGKSETKKSIQNVLDHVVGNYKYTSLPELNAVLQQYNVWADRGRETSKLYQHKGLLYRVLDAEGKPVGVPIKASAFYRKPTLKLLEEQFRKNAIKRMPHKVRIKNTIDMALLGNEAMSVQDLLKVLEKDGVSAVLRQRKDISFYGITYVDHRTKCVFNDSELGTPYSAKAIQERCRQRELLLQEADFQQAENQRVFRQYSSQNEIAVATSGGGKKAKVIVKIADVGKVLDNLMQSEHPSDYLPYPLKRNRKKKAKRKGILNNR